MNDDSRATKDRVLDSSSYGQIVKSSSIMGGVAAFGLLLSMVRTKFAAMLIGTTGIGLLAGFMAVQNVVAMLASLGIHSSAVRDVASAYARESSEEIGRAVLTLRRTCWITGIAGALAMLLLSPWLSEMTFGSGEYRWHIAALGLTILLGSLQGGQIALIQGTRRIADLARVQMAAALVSTVTSLACYYWLGLEGLIPALLLVSISHFGVSWHISRQVPVPRVQMSYRESFHDAKGMARLGIAMMWTGLVSSAATYIISIIITRQISLQALGIYTAAFALSGMFANFVLGAMGSDYYPRLAGVAGDNDALNRLVNEQTEVGLLLAVPGLLATLTLAPWIVEIFYTSEFLPAATLLQWFALGCLGRVISWPLSYLLMAKSKGAWLAACETSIHTVHVLLAFAGMHYLGLLGTAVAFFVLYLLYVAMVFFIGRQLSAFSWTPECRAQIARGTALMLIGWLIAQLDSRMLSTSLGLVCIALAALHTLFGLTSRLGQAHPLSRLIGRSLAISRMSLSRFR